MYKRQELEQVGLCAPQVTYIMHDLKKRGFQVSTDVTTVEEAAEEIINSLKTVSYTHLDVYKRQVMEIRLW